MGVSNVSMSSYGYVLKTLVFEEWESQFITIRVKDIRVLTPQHRSDL